MNTTILRQSFSRYQSDVMALLDELSAYSDDQLNRKPADGGWSAIQTMHHLIVADEMSWAYVEKKMHFEPNPAKRVGVQTHWRAFLLWGFMNLPIKIKIPKVLEQKQNLPEFGSLADSRARWEAILAKWAHFFDTMPESLADKVVYKHPRVDKIGWKQMLDFFQMHFDRHRNQIRRALK